MIKINHRFSVSEDAKYKALEYIDHREVSCIAIAKGKVYVYDNARVYAYGDAEVGVCGNAIVDAYGRSKVYIYDGSHFAKVELHEDAESKTCVDSGYAEVQKEYFKQCIDRNKYFQVKKGSKCRIHKDTLELSHGDIIAQSGTLIDIPNGYVKVFLDGQVKVSINKGAEE